MSNVRTETFFDFLPKIMQKIQPGYYAVRREGGVSGEIDFFRVSLPETGQYAGTYKVQTQHGENLLNALIVWPEGHWKCKRGPDGRRGSDLRSRTEVVRGYVQTVLLEALPDLFEAALLYSEEKGVCWRCNTDLTLERSRFYSIGPDCEEKAQWFIMEQIMRKGFFEHHEVEL